VQKRLAWQDVARKPVQVVDEVTQDLGSQRVCARVQPAASFQGCRFLLNGGGTHEILKDFLGRLLIGKMDAREGIASNQ